jgi:NCS1 family nucleobase:cation symporter-1
MAAIEERNIDYIPDSERHGSVANLAPFWFSCSVLLITVVTGALLVSLGLNLAWAIVATVLGTTVGAIFMAYHSAQGPKMGIPQMIQSRAQFGVKGALTPLIVVVIMYIGYFASNSYLGGTTLAYANIPIVPGIIIANVVALIVAFIGYDVLHLTFRWIAILNIILFGILSIFVFRLPLPAGSLVLGPVKLGPFLLGLSFAAIWQISYAPYVSDYSRYLPKNTSIKASFWYTYAGTVVSSVWLFILGATMAVAIPDSVNNMAVGLAKVWHMPGAFLVILVLFITIAFINSSNLYGGFLTLLTGLEPYVKIKNSVKSRFAFFFGICLAGTILGILGSSNFMTWFSNFMSLLLYTLVPWTAINLVDFYLIQRGEYDVPAIFDPDGKYGRYNWRSLSVYFVTIVFEIPFFNVTFYQGPVSKALGGADISWIVGLIFAAVVYYIVARVHQNRVTTCTSSKGQSV